ncbi:MAG: DUF4340 domain-containing protein, partial [Gemmataceae bacterium]
MNFRSTAILLGLALALVGGLLAIALLRDDGLAPDAVLLEPFTSTTKPETIDTIEIARTEPAEQKIVFAKVGDRWEIREPVTARAEPFVLNALARELVTLKPTFHSDTPEGLTDAGLAAPTVMVTIREGSKSATLRVGNTTTGKERAVTFVSTDTRPKTVVAVRRGDLDSLFAMGSGSGTAAEHAKTLTDFRQRRILMADLRDPMIELSKLTLTQHGKTVTLNRNPAGDWLFETPSGYGLADAAGDPDAKPDIFTGMRAILTTLSGLSAGANEDFIEKPDAPETYGLKKDDPAVIRIEVTPKTGAAEVLLIGKKVDAKVGAAAPVKFFAQRVGDPAVVKVQTDRFDALAKTIADPSPLRDRTLVPELTRERIDAIDILINGQTVKLRRGTVGAAKEWLLYGGPSDPQLAGPHVKDLLDALTKPRIVKDILPTANAKAFEGAERKAEIRFWYDGTEFAPLAKDAKPGDLPAEPKLKNATPNTTILIGRVEGD